MKALRVPPVYKCIGLVDAVQDFMLQLKILKSLRLVETMICSNSKKMNTYVH